MFGFIKVVYNPFNLFFLHTLDRYTIMFLVSLPLNECEVEVDLVLIQTSLLMEVILKNTGKRKNSAISLHCNKAEGLYRTPASFPSTTVTWATFP